jgi:hypothetical protein
MKNYIEFKLAAVQAAPVYFDAGDSVDHTGQDDLFYSITPTRHRLLLS